MDPLTESTEVPYALGSLIDEQQDLAASARETQELVEAKILFFREAVDDEAVARSQIQHCERILGRLRALAATRERAASAVTSGDTSETSVLRLLKASLEEDAFLDSLDEDIRFEVPAETLDRYAAAFEAVAQRPFNRGLDSITWDDAG